MPIGGLQLTDYKLTPTVIGLCEIKDTPIADRKADG